MAEPRASSPAIYQLRVVLRGVSPLVWRRLLVSSETPLAELHEILQLAFDWSNDHLHRFLIHGTAYGVPRLGGISFRDDARRVPLSRFRLHRGERFRYEYDFTADWQLDLRLERVLPFDPKCALPSCTGGSRAAPTEDCAGVLTSENDSDEILTQVLIFYWAEVVSSNEACPSTAWEEAPPDSIAYVPKGHEPLRLTPAASAGRSKLQWSHTA